MKSQSQNRMLTSGRLLAVIMMMWILSGKVLASPSQLTYQGRILKADGTPLEYNNVSFLFQITNPSGACIIYQEQVTGYNMVNSGGVFDVPIGAGTVQYPLGVASILDAFNNSSTFTCGVCSLSGGGYTCADGSSSYAAADGDQRKLRVSFYDGSGWKTISPDSIIRSVPFAGYALSAQKLGNNVASDFLVKAGLPTCGAGTFLSWNGSALSCAGVSGANGGTVTNVISSNSYLSVVNGATTPTLTVNVGTTVNTVAAGNDSRLTNALQTGATAGGDLTGTLPSPTVAKIQGVSVNANAPASGEFFKFTGTNWTSSVINTSDVNGLSTTLNSYLTQSAFNGYVASASCTSGQTMYWNSVSGNFQCQSVSVASSQVNFGAQAANTVFAAPIAGGTPSFRALASSDLPAGTLSGTGTAGYVPYYTSGSTLTNSALYTSGGNVGIGTTTPTGVLDVNGVRNGTGTLTGTTTAIAGSGTAFITELATGDIISAGGEERYVIATADDANLTINTPFVNALSGTAFTIKKRTSLGVGATVIGESAPKQINSGVGLFAGSVPKMEILTGTVNWSAYSDLVTIRHASALNTAVQRQLGLMLKLSDESSATESAKSGGIIVESANGWANSPTLSLITANARRLTIDASGNVGVATTSPKGQMHIGVDPTAISKYPLFAAGAGPFDGTTSGYFNGSSNGTVVGINTVAGFTGDFLNFQIGGVSKYKVDNSGNITSSGNIVSSGNATSTGNYTTTGNISTTGTGAISSSGILSANSGTASTSSTTGALVVSGGVGVSGALNVGNNISSNGSITSGGVFKAAYGTAAAPSYSYTSDVTTGDFAPSAGVWAVSTGGVERFRVNSSGNVGIGTTTPSYPLDVNGVIKSSNAIYGTSFNLSGSGQALNWPGNTEKVQANSTSHYMQLFTNGSEAIRIDGSGNVGIGTNSPVRSLQVTGANVTSGSLSSEVFISDTTAYNASPVGGVHFSVPYKSDGTTAGMGGISSGKENTADGDNSGYLALHSRPNGGNITERLRISSTGNVGIGTTNPNALLALAGDGVGIGEKITSARTDGLGSYIWGQTSRGTSSSPAASNNTDGAFTLAGYLHNGTSFNPVANISFLGDGSQTTSSAPGVLSFMTTTSGSIAASEKMRITNAGNVGIGTASPSSQLDVTNSSASTGVMDVMSVNSSNNTINKNLAFTFKNQGTPVARIESDYTSSSNVGLAFSVYNFSLQRAMTLTAQGNVGIGTSTPGYKLDINGDANIVSGSALRFGGTQVCTSAGCTSSSDSRLKENIKPLENSLEKILSLQGVEYDYKDKSKFGERHQIGVIGQDVEKVFPEVVVTDQKTTLKSVAYDHLIAPLIESVKALYMQISGVEAVQTLQARKIASVEASKADKTETDALKEELKTKDQKIKELEQRLEKIEKAIRSR